MGDFFLDDPLFPFSLPPQSSSCPFLHFDRPSPFPAGLDLADPTPFLLRDLTDRVAALELAARRPDPATRKYTSVTESAGRKVKWTAVDRRGERDLKWEAELKSPNDHGFDRKWKWESKGGRSSSARKLKWGASVKGKGCLEPWSQSYTWEEDFAASDDDQEDEEERTLPKPTTEKKKKKPIKEKKCPASTTIKIEEIPYDNDPGCVAIRKAFAMGNGKDKKKELSPQDAAFLIQITYRAHLAHRSQVLCCLRDLAVAKAKLKEIRSMFYNISYRHRIAHDQEERQRFTEKIIILLLTVDALEGPDYMVRTAKKSMLEELEAMLEVVDPQPPGKQRSLSRRKFDLPEGGAISDKKKAAVNNAVRVIDSC